MVSDALVESVYDAHTHVGLVEMKCGPNNFLDINLLTALTDAMDALDRRPDCRAIVLVADGKHFCAGRDFSKPRGPGDDSASMYREAGRLIDVSTPWVAVVQGAAIGAGCGLAMCADFRFGTSRSYFHPNFVSLGIHHGFGLTVTLPRVVGIQRATELLYLGRKIGAEQAFELGMLDRLEEEEALRSRALAFAAEIAAAPPLAVRASRATMRAGLADAFRAATVHESREQSALMATADFAEAAAAARERRPGAYVAQ